MLIAASEAEDVEQVRTLLKEGADPSEIDRYETSALLRAVFQRNLEIINLLLSAGADLNYIYEQGSISAVSSAGREDILLALLHHEPQTYVKIHALKHFLRRDHVWAAKHIVQTLPEEIRSIPEDGIALFEAAGQPRPHPFARVIQKCQDATLAPYGGMALTQRCRYAYVLLRIHL